MSVPLTAHLLPPTILARPIADEQAWDALVAAHGDGEATPDELESWAQEASFSAALERWPGEAPATGIARWFGGRRAIAPPGFLRLFRRLLWSTHGDSRTCDYPSLHEDVVLTAISPATARELLGDWDERDFAARRGEAEVALDGDDDLDWDWFAEYARAWIALLQRAQAEERALVIRVHS